MKNRRHLHERIARSLTRAQRDILGRLTRRSVIQSYVSSHTIRKLNLGSGSGLLDGWLNTDIRRRTPHHVRIDVTKPFPIEDESFDFVYSEHLIEHFSYAQGLAMLAQCHRILRPGGRMRIATPNLSQIASLACEPKTELQLDYIAAISKRYLHDSRGPNASFIINGHFSVFGHRFLYDSETLEISAREAGFDHFSWWEPGKSDDPNLSCIEAHGRVVGEDVNSYETMVMEAVRS